MFFRAANICDNMSTNKQENFEERLKDFSKEFEDSFRRSLNQLQQRVQEQFDRYENKIRELQLELDDRERKLITMQWKHDIEQKEIMDKLKNNKQ